MSRDGTSRVRLLRETEDDAADARLFHQSSVPTILSSLIASRQEVLTQIDLLDWSRRRPVVPALYEEVDISLLLERVALSEQHTSVHRRILNAVRERLDALEDTANDDDISPSLSSRGDLVAFINTIACSRAPLISLLENGNFRAQWTGSGDASIGLQFLGAGVIQYVLIFPDEGRGAYCMGRADLKKIRRFVESADLGSLFWI